MRYVNYALLVVALGATALGSCSSDSTGPGDQTTTDTNGGSGTVTTGRLSVWTDYQGANITVSVDGSTVGTTSAAFTTAPACGQAGTVTVTVSAGSHGVSGVGGGNNWSGNVSVDAGGCTLFRLAAPTPPPQAVGQLSVWTNYSNQIAVRIDGTAVGNLTTYFPTSPPTCGQAGTVTITLSAGTHAIAGSSGSLTWNGAPNVVAGQCTLYELIAPVGPPTGQLSIWTNYRNQIALKVDGTAVGSTTSYFANGPPTCGQAGTVTVTLPAGPHTISGSSGTLTWNGTATVVAGQCTLFELNAPAPAPTGQISVWTNYSTQISVGIDGTPVGTLTQYFPNGPPTCGQAGTLTVTVPAGTHSISGLSGALTWSGTATAVAGQCTLFELDAPTGGGASTGQLSIWTNYPTQIAVRVDGSAVGTTTSYFATGTPTCGQAGTITVTLTAGTHTISGVSGTVTWNGTATVVAGQCSLFELRSP
jgi:hypothetical protein